MRKFVIPVLLVFILIAAMSAPALAGPQAAVPMPAGTASPRNWDKLAPNDELSQTAIKADSAILVDAFSGKILYEKNADTKRFPASTTKIMTCLLALDSGKDLSELVTVGQLPKMQSDATNIDLKNGEQLTLEDLLYGLMLMSGNDAANAIAVYISGSIDNFVGKMNDKATELGMTGTHYKNTNGLHDDEHYTTAKDMATLAIAARKYPEFVKIVKTYQYTMAATNMHKNSRVWTNHNLLISTAKKEPYAYTYATGIKTGFTDEAKQALVSSAEKGNVSLISVVLHDNVQTDKWVDSVTMFEYGFKYYDTFDVQSQLANQTIPLDVKNAATSDSGQGKLDLTLLVKNKQYITDRKDEIEKLKNDPTLIQQELNITKDTAPIKKGDVVGTVTFTYQGTAVLTCDLLAPRDVNEMPTPAPSESSSATKSAAPGSNNATAAPGSTQPTQGQQKGGSSAFVWIGVILLLLLLALVAIRMVNMQRRTKKYRHYNYRQDSSSKLKR